MIKTKNLSKKFGDFLALDNISCCIPKGSIYGMVGSNGAGKSTLVRLLTGVYEQDSGEVTIEGERVYDNEFIKSKMLFVPDELFFLPGADMNRMVSLYQGIHPNFDKEICASLSDSFGLTMNKSLSTLSKGMRRQVAIILALASRPDYLFFDETFDGLDPIMRNHVKELIYNDVRERNTTVVITSHSLKELEDLCDQLAMLHKGGLVLESDVQNLKTSLFKAQIAFSDDYDQSRFQEIDIVRFQKKGSVSNLIIRGNQDEAVERLKQMEPLLVDILPLSLEEVFIYEMETKGYAYTEESDLGGQDDKKIL